MVTAQCFDGQSQTGLRPLLKGKSQKTKAKRMAQSHYTSPGFSLKFTNHINTSFTPRREWVRQQKQWEHHYRERKMRSWQEKEDSLEKVSYDGWRVVLEPSGELHQIIPVPFSLRFFFSCSLNVNIIYNLETGYTYQVCI